MQDMSLDELLADTADLLIAGADQLPAIQQTVTDYLNQGLTLTEISARTGQSIDCLASLPGVGITAAHLARVQHAMLDRAIGGATYFAETLDRDGIPRKLQRSVGADTVAGKTLLAAHMPERYGQAAGQSATVVIVTDPSLLRAAMKNVDRTALEHEGTGVVSAEPG